jgi:hypothetical protein
MRRWWWFGALILAALLACEGSARAASSTLLIGSYGGIIELEDDQGGFVVYDDVALTIDREGVIAGSARREKDGKDGGDENVTITGRVATPRRIDRMWTVLGVLQFSDGAAAWGRFEAGRLGGAPGRLFRGAGRSGGFAGRVDLFENH